MKKLFIASTSTVHGKGYLEYILPELKLFFGDVSEILFIPYARPGGMSYNDYTNIVKRAFSNIGITVKGIHEYENTKEAVKNAQGIFTGGGNTFELVNKLYSEKIMDEIRFTVENGTPYFGTSAGSNIAGLSMKTTNDMPIIYPPSFDTLQLINFNINPHYLDPDPSSTHMGETRETRIKEFHEFNDIPVLGLREGSWLEVLGNIVIIRGKLNARLFLKNEEPKKLPPNTDISYL